MVGLVLALVGCTAPSSVTASTPGATPTVRPAATPTTTPLPTVLTTTAIPTTPTPAIPTTTPSRDPRWRFFTNDKRLYASPWYAGAHPIMIGFGCTDAPYYRSDSRCRGGEGFHHGVDMAIPCGEPITSGVEGRIVRGGLGSAYGAYAFRIRTESSDVLIAHAQQVDVSDGQRVRPGDRLGEIGALGAPDGCHLHFEVRAVGGGLSTAIDPTSALALRPAT